MSGGDRPDAPAPSTEETGASGRSGPLGWIGRHRVITAAAVLVLVLAIAGGSYAYYLNSLLGEVTRLPETTLPEETRPQVNETGAVTILLAGADNSPGADTVAESMAADTWPVDEHRSDTIMVLHIPENRKKAYLLSIPRDSYVQIYDETGEPVGKNKINSAFSTYGPAGDQSTIEHLAGMRMDHLAIVDWAGFKDIVDALGGITVYVPETTEPDAKLGDIVFERGNNEMDGETALKYVRSRSTFELQDIGRIDRQQNFLRAVVKKVTETGMLTSPRSFAQTFKAIAQNLTVDAEWDNGSLRSFAWSVRNLKTQDLKAMSAPLDPVEPFPTFEDVGSAVRLDLPALRRLFTSMKNDDVASHVRAHPELLLPDADEIE
jgi:LCP family protein required for cell wall assembly